MADLVNRSVDLSSKITDLARTAGATAEELITAGLFIVATGARRGGLTEADVLELYRAARDRVDLTLGAPPGGCHG